MNEKKYLLEVTNFGKYALWQSNVKEGNISCSRIITMPIGEKSSAIYTKEGSEEQALVIIEKDFCIIEATTENGKLTEIVIRKVTDIIDDCAVTKKIHEFKEEKWNENPFVFFQKPIGVCTYNVQNQENALEYFKLSQKIAFYRTCQKQCG